MDKNHQDEVELLNLLQRLSREMTDLFKHIEEANEKMVSRLEKKVHEEMALHDKRQGRASVFEESTLE